MSERQKQTAFLKKLLDKEESGQRERLQEEIFQAEQNEKCVRSAMTGVGVVALLCVCGLCYEAILAADLFQDTTYLLTRLFGYLGLGSLICWVVFLGSWAWYRALTNRLYEDCRRLLTSRFEKHGSSHRTQDCLSIGHELAPDQNASVLSHQSHWPMSEPA